MIQVDNAFAVAAPPAVVFDALSDAETVIACLPGARLVGAVDTRNVLGEARVAFGRNTISYRGSLHVTGDDSAAMRISFRVRGREMRGEGVVEAIIDVVLRDAGARGTVATVQADASISGRASSFPGDVVEDAARTLLTRFGAALATRIGGAAAAEAEAPEADKEQTMTTDSGPLDPPASAERPVAGEVRLMTQDPVELPASPSLVQCAMRELDSKPWLAPATLLALVLAVILLRRRR